MSRSAWNVDDIEEPTMCSNANCNFPVQLGFTKCTICRYEIQYGITKSEESTKISHEYAFPNTDESEEQTTCATPNCNCSVQIGAHKCMICIYNINLLNQIRNR